MDLVMFDTCSLGLDKAHVGTAGAYVEIGGYYLFTVAPKSGGNTLAVIRLGGHCEASETGWQCAVRELYEEAHINIRPLKPPVTYWVDRDRTDMELQRVMWSSDISGEVPPVLIGSNNPMPTCQLSLMYLAHTNESPNPSSEVRGLLMLKPNEVHKIAQETVTLGQYIRSGGRAILLDAFDEDKVLEPFFQLRAFSRILQLNSKYRVEQGMN